LKIPNLTANWPIGDLVSRCWFETPSASLNGQQFFE
jgi:hypothetical protein